MKTELNEKVYEAVYLTDEEKVIIDALRAGATARINWFDLTYEEVVKITDELPKGVLTTRETIGFYNANFPFVVFAARSKKVDLNLYVGLIQKNTDRRQAKSVTE